MIISNFFIPKKLPRKFWFQANKNVFISTVQYMQKKFVEIGQKKTNFMRLTHTQTGHTVYAI